MNIKKIKGKKRRHLAIDFCNLGFTKGVEIGTCHGTFAAVLCENNPNLMLKTIDPYIAVYQDRRTQRIGNEKQEGLYKQAKKRLKHYNCEIVRKHSLEAVIDYPYESIDFVYIDGSHEFDYVMCDIIEWGKRIKKGGIVSGHDYVKRSKVRVIRAVDNYAEVHGVKEVYITDETSPTWWFKKTW
jgi:hypothetical protein